MPAMGGAAGADVNCVILKGLYDNGNNFRY